MVVIKFAWFLFTLFLFVLISFIGDNVCFRFMYKLNNWQISIIKFLKIKIHSEKEYDTITW